MMEPLDYHAPECQRPSRLPGRISAAFVFSSFVLLLVSAYIDSPEVYVPFMQGFVPFLQCAFVAMFGIGVVVTGIAMCARRWRTTPAWASLWTIVVVIVVVLVLQGVRFILR